MKISEEITERESIEDTIPIWEHCADNPGDNPLSYPKMSYIYFKYKRNACPVCKYFHDKTPESPCGLCPVRSCINQRDDYMRYYSCVSSKGKKQAAQRIVNKLKARLQQIKAG